MELNPQFFQHVAFTAFPLALDKLHHAHFHAVPGSAGRSTKGRCRFPFPVTGEDHQDSAGLLSRGNAPVDMLFQFLLPLLITFVAHANSSGKVLDQAGWPATHFSHFFV